MPSDNGLENTEPFDRILREIIARPDDDEPRLEFASEWEQRAKDYGLDRARFIRWQVELSRMDENHPEWFRLASQTNELRVRKGSEWLPPALSDDQYADPEFDRGFVEALTLRCNRLPGPSFASELLSLAPLRHFSLVEAISEDLVLDVIRALIEAGGRERVLSLRMDAQDLTDRTPQFLADAGLTRLRWLSLAYNKIMEEGAWALAIASREGRLPDLDYVNLSGNPRDITEQLQEDQGVVVGTFMPDRYFPDVRWLRKSVRFGRALPPSRFGFHRDQPFRQ